MLQKENKPTCSGPSPRDDELPMAPSVRPPDAVVNSQVSHTSHVTRHTSHVTRHTSHVTRHMSHVTRHTSHVTRHTSHVTLLACRYGCKWVRSLQSSVGDLMDDKVAAASLCLRWRARVTCEAGDCARRAVGEGGGAAVGEINAPGNERRVARFMGSAAAACRETRRMMGFMRHTSHVTEGEAPR